MHRLSSFVLVPFVSTSLATYHCIDFGVTLNVTAPSFEVAFPPFQNQSESVAFLLDITSRNVSDPSSLFKGGNNVTSSFDISARYCTPAAKSQSSTVQVLTHGLGFDKSYWEFGGPGSPYNYIQSATDAGYSTLSYDRIGTGLSSYPDPYNIGQAPTELAVLATLTGELRLGLLSKDIPEPQTVVHVGHSFGSILTHGLAATAPNLTDGIVLTGYSTNNTWQSQWLASTLFHIASVNRPVRFGNLSSGYLTWGSRLANQYGFFHYPYFADSVLKTAETNKYPFTIGEVTTGPLVTKVAAAFTGPVLLLSGLYDLIFCGADCTGVLQQASSYFPSASIFQTYTQPDTGHGINLHYNATGAYGVIKNFLNANF